MSVHLERSRDALFVIGQSDLFDQYFRGVIFSDGPTKVFPSWVTIPNSPKVHTILYVIFPGWCKSYMVKGNQARDFCTLCVIDGKFPIMVQHVLDVTLYGALFDWGDRAHTSLWWQSPTIFRTVNGYEAELT